MTKYFLKKGLGNVEKVLGLLRFIGKGVLDRFLP